MNIGEYIKKTRKERDMSQRDLAYASHLSNAEISRIESGFRKNPSPDTLKSIASALHIPAETLFEIAGFIEKKLDPITADTINLNEYICVSDLTENERADVKKYIAFLKSQRS